MPRQYTKIEMLCEEIFRRKEQTKLTEKLQKVKIKQAVGQMPTSKDAPDC